MISLLNGQCKCMDNGSGDAIEDPVMIVDLGGNKSIAVCGYDEARYGTNKAKMSDFNVLDCNTTKSLVAYGKNKTCMVQYHQNILTITEETYLPVGNNWEWEFIPVSKMDIKLVNNKIKISDTKPVFKIPKPTQTSIDAFFKEIETYKNEKIVDEWENVIGKLQVLALLGNAKATQILFDFKNYFNFEPDELVLPIYNDAVSMVKWYQSTQP